MTSRLPWVAAALIIAAAVGTWAIYGGAPAAQPTPTPTPTPAAEGAWTSFSVWGAGTPATSGIENVFIMNHPFGDDADDNLFHLQTVDTEDNGPKENENIYEYNDNDQVLRASGDTITVIADNAFDIVVIYKVHSTECIDPTDTSKFSSGVRISGNLSVAENDNSVSKFCFDNDQSNGAAGTTWGRWAAVYNGGGNGYQISAGQTFTIDSVALNVWK